jgi:hypothetical protein
MRNYPVTILSAVDTASATGSAIFVGQAVAASFTVYASGDAAGTVKLQASNDIPVGDPVSFVPTHWVDITSATITVASGTGPALVLATMNFQYIRAVYTRSSGGSSTIVVNMSALGV